MSDPDFETWPESAQTKRVPQPPDQQRSFRVLIHASGKLRLTEQEAAEIQAMSEESDQQRSEVVRNFDKEDWKEMRQIISDQSAAIASLKAENADLRQQIARLTQ